MSDRTYGAIRIYRCPDEQRQALANALKPLFGLDVNWSQDVPTLEDDEIRCGSIYVYARQWADAAPDAVWMAWESPRYEWLGTAAYFCGSLATFDCDDAGEPVIYLSDIIENSKSDTFLDSREFLDKIVAGHAVYSQVKQEALQRSA